jgi:hypothetical protein
MVKMGENTSLSLIIMILKNNLSFFPTFEAFFRE